MQQLRGEQVQRAFDKGGLDKVVTFDLTRFPRRLSQVIGVSRGPCPKPFALGL